MYAAGYAKAMDKNFEKGYARKVPLSELSGDQYFHPNLGVTKPGEPGKVRRAGAHVQQGESFRRRRAFSAFLLERIAGRRARGV